MTLSYELESIRDKITQQTLLRAIEYSESLAIAHLARADKLFLQEIAVSLGLNPPRKYKNFDLASDIFKKMRERGFPLPKGINDLLDKAITVNAVDRWEWNGSDIMLVHPDGDRVTFDTVAYDIGFSYLKTYLEGLIKATDLYSCCFKKEESDRA